MITESYLLSLLNEELDFPLIIKGLENLGRRWEPGLECHHLEPERKETVWLTTLEHLAIHIAHARLDPSGSNRAKVAAFVKYYPGNARFTQGNYPELNPELVKALISFGQVRSNSYDLLLKVKKKCELCGAVITGKANMLRHLGSKKCQRIQMCGGSVPQPSTT